MVVTVSLARGAVRAAAERQSRLSATALAQLKKLGYEAPATLRRYAEWFRKHQAAHEKHALLIVFGMIGRRTGAFSAYLPQFQEIDGAWNLGIHLLQFEFSPGNLQSVEMRRLPVRISGHALERMFQRTNTVEWPVIRDCLAGATLFLNAAMAAYRDSGCRRCAIPAEKGTLVGQVADGVMNLRTFLPDSNLSPKWQSLYDDLRTFAANNTEEINRAALAPDDHASRLLGEVLKLGKFRWLSLPYSPGHDPLEDAWASKGAAPDAEPEDPT